VAATPPGEFYLLEFLKRKSSYSFNDGSLAMQRGNRERARDIWIEVGRAGDARAQFALAEWYTDETERCLKSGSDLRSSVQHAYDWGDKAAEQGHIEAQVWVGRDVQLNGILQQQLEPIAMADRARVQAPFEVYLWPLQLVQLKSYESGEGLRLTDQDLKFLEYYWDTSI